MALSGHYPSKLLIWLHIYSLLAGSIFVSNLTLLVNVGEVIGLDTKVEKQGETH